MLKYEIKIDQVFAGATADDGGQLHRPYFFQTGKLNSIHKQSWSYQWVQVIPEKAHTNTTPGSHEGRVYIISDGQGWLIQSGS